MSRFCTNLEGITKSESGSVLSKATKILYLLSAKREKEGNEKCKDDAYNIDHGFRPKSL
ncbi:unnamed protein product [Pocillopora meandrina]|uniref:Uncharacterized protein n=1 Tax=Pocillopora meandrina TaxID=46732 RepID=A0AAU9WA49_9CNID|nr:unnamed protein product [Pocillopora meandrina]